nr:GtrA family protein [Kofleriaceae bacterium]
MSPAWTNHFRTMIKSSVTSLLVVGVEVLLIELLSLVNVPEIVSYAAVQIIGTCLTFLGNKFWVFEAGRTGSVFAEGAKAIAVFGGSLVLNTALPSIGSYWLGAPPVPSFLVSQVVVYLAWNYPLNRWWVFPSRRAQQAQEQAASGAAERARVEPE